MAVTLEWVRDNYDTIIKDRYIDADEALQSVNDFFNGLITNEQLNAVQDAANNHTLLPAYSTPGTETRTTSLTEGNHDIQISLAGYDTLVAVINVSSTIVSCVSVAGGACGGTGLPRLETSGWTVTAYMKEGTSVGAKCTWINAQTHNQVAWISELIKAYFGRVELGFVVQGNSAYISSAIKVYFGRATIAEEFGC